MRNPVEQFLADAKSINLNARERSDAFSVIFPKNFTSAASGIELSDKEFELGERAFVSYMCSFKLESDHFSFFDFIAGKKFLSASLAAAFIIATAGGGAAYAAEDSLPGDFLYPVKVNFTEPMREHMRFDPDIRARWAEKRIKRRLEETENLMSRGDITVEKINMMREKIEVQRKNLENRISVLPEGIPDEIRSHMENRMREHQKFLMSFERGAEEPAVRKNEIKNMVRMHRVNMMKMSSFGKGRPPAMR